MKKKILQFLTDWYKNHSIVQGPAELDFRIWLIIQNTNKGSLGREKRG